MSTILEPISTSATSSNSTYHPAAWCLATCDETCQMSFYYYAFIISTVFCILTCAICIYNACQHFVHFNNPYFQSKIIIIILMPPVYCITSTLSFLSVRLSSYITLARDLYEMFGLFAFFYLILAFIAYDPHNNRLDEKIVYLQMCDSASQIPHDSPCNYFQKAYQLPNWRKAKFFVTRCKRAVLQFILLKIVTSALLCLVYPQFQLQIRVQSDWDYQIYNKINNYIYWITALSSYVGYYYMSMLYSCLHEKLKPFKPDLKFITFNSTMYYTYWQKVWMMFFQNRISACFDLTAHVYGNKKLMYCIQNFLICIEMLFMALAILQAYKYQDYVVPIQQNRVASFMEIFRDIIHIFKIEMRLVKPTPSGFTSTCDIAETELLTLDSLKNIDRYKMRIIGEHTSLSEALIQSYF